MGRILALADVLLVHLRDTHLFRITIPSKIQAYLAAGKPIIAGVRGDAADIIRSSGAGKVAVPENAAEIVDKLLEVCHLSDDERKGMGISGRGFYEKTMSLAVGVGRFESIFNRIRADVA
jgi:colanic acid biosynthesis glycosyl transferase WcaI